MQTKEFLNNVCEQIKYKPIRNSISEELENHIEESKENYIEEGMQEKEAEEKVKDGIREGLFDPPENCIDSWCETEEIK